MNNTKILKLISALLIAMAVLLGCEKDQEIPETPTDNTQTEDPNIDSEQNGVKITNIRLLVALKRKGLNFEEDRLIIDDKVKNLKSLDLSDESIKSLDGLELFPNLEEINLSDNEMKIFDFAKLPTNIKSVQLQGNPIRDYLNLKPNRKFKKLYLSKMAYFDMGLILNYYRANKDDASLDMKYEKDDVLVSYNFLRDVPDEIVLAKLKELFPTVFTGNQIDMSKTLSSTEQTTYFKLGISSEKPPILKTLDGIQFIICRDEYKGKIAIKSHFRTPLSYFRAPKNVPSIYFYSAKIPDEGLFDMSTAVNAHSIYLNAIYGNITNLDFSKNTKIGNPMANNGKGGKLFLYNFDELTTLTMPDNWATMEKVKVCFRFRDLSKLKELDLSKITSGIAGIPNILAHLTVRNDINIIYPDKFEKQAETGGDEIEKTLFVTDRFLRETDGWKTFAEKFKDIIRYGNEGKSDYINFWEYHYGEGWDF